MPINRRRMIWFLAFVALGAITVGGVCAWESSRDPINRADYDRIQLGMTLAEVEEILGSTADATLLKFPEFMFFTPIQDVLDSQGGARDMSDFFRRQIEHARMLRPLYRSRRRSILIVYEPDGRVVGKEFSRVRQNDWWDMVIDFFGL